MARLVSLDGQTYRIPERGDVGWGSLTDLLEKLANDVNALNQSQLANPIPLRRRVRQITTTPQTLLDSDDVVLIATNSISSINLMDSATVQVGKILTIKDELGVAETLTIEIVGFGSQTIDGANSYTINDAFGDVSFVKKEDGNWARIQSLPEDFEFGLIPVGTILPLTTHLTGSITPPPSGVIANGLMLCDGSAIPVGATLSGTLPDLTDERFLRGSTSSGTSGNATDLTHTHDFAHTHTTDSQLSSVNFAHDHTGSTGGSLATFTGSLPTSGGVVQFNKTELNTDQQTHNHDYQFRYTFAFATFSQISGGGNTLIEVFDYNTSTYLGGITGSTPPNRTFNAGLTSSTTATSSGNLKTMQGTTSLETINWNSATVNCTVVNPSLNSTFLNGQQNSHSHSISSDLGTENFAHSHTTNSQNTTTTGDALNAVTVTPQYFDVLYVMRVL